MQATQELRFRTLFNEEETQKLSKSIKKISNQLKQDLKKVEKNIRIYVNEELLEVGGENDLQSQLKNNMSQNILTELNSFSKKFKYNQEIYSQKCVNENDPGQNFLMKDESDQILQNRDNELNDIVYRVNNLQELFKDLNVIVIEQGSILDRIDYNIDIGFNNISKGKQKIISANEHHKSSCFRNVILFLLMCIFVESLLILFKFL